SSDLAVDPAAPAFVRAAAGVRLLDLRPLLPDGDLAPGAQAALAAAGIRDRRRVRLPRLRYRRTAVADRRPQSQTPRRRRSGPRRAVRPHAAREAVGGP